MIKIFTDGSCLGNPGKGGWAAIIINKGEKKILFGKKINTTNNQMEMQAALEALKHLKDKDEVIELYTDSNYLRQGITEWIHKWKKNNWRTAAKKPVANRDLWIEISDLDEKMTVQWNWVKGHAGDPGNEKADELANIGAESV